ncbi:MAG: hypothetical protein F4213_03340 [Boseongicola sp. SB0677_bin_26]|nr:hypothetical protein [Boseongicola sp. SB0665_bin_10]MYG25049.1 hypothetical protein [Boseongicola sp. SB0677_bin_26]
MFCDTMETRGPVRLVRIRSVGPDRLPTYWLVHVQAEGTGDWHRACEPCSETAARERFDEVCGLVEKEEDA